MATYTHIYKFPVADCSRHGGCTDCLGSRDPHCYWNRINGACETNNIGTVNDDGTIAFNATKYVTQFSGCMNMITWIKYMYVKL